MLLLASAEVTLGVGAIARMLWNKVWPYKRAPGHASLRPDDSRAPPQTALGPARTLYELGLQTNQQLLAGILENNKVG